jgi:hypothetical protein
VADELERRRFLQQVEERELKKGTPGYWDNHWDPRFYAVFAQRDVPFSTISKVQRIAADFGYTRPQYVVSTSAWGCDLD